MNIAVSALPDRTSRTTQQRQDKMWDFICGFIILYFTVLPMDMIYPYALFLFFCLCPGVYYNSLFVKVTLVVLALGIIPWQLVRFERFRQRVEEWVEIAEDAGILDDLGESDPNEASELVRARAVQIEMGQVPIRR